MSDCKHEALTTSLPFGKIAKFGDPIPTSCPITLICEHCGEKMSLKHNIEEAIANGAEPKNGTAFKKFDSEKANWHLMPEEALAEVLKVLEFGAKKYGDFNWLDNASKVDWTRYINALERHLKAFKQGADSDKDSGLLELAHIATNAIMLLTYQLNSLGVDNRRKRSNK